MSEDGEGTSAGRLRVVVECKQSNGQSSSEEEGPNNIACRKVQMTTDALETAGEPLEDPCYEGSFLMARSALLARTARIPIPLANVRKTRKPPRLDTHRCSSEHENSVIGQGFGGL